MIPSPYPAAAVCVEPGLGAEATRALGRRVSARVAAHLEACPACRLQRRAFEELDRHAAPPPPELRGQIRAVLEGPSSVHTRR